MNTNTKTYTAGLLTLGNNDILGWMIFFAGSCPVHDRMVSGIPGLYSFSPLPSCDRQKCPSILPMPPEGSENHCYIVHDNLFMLGVEVNILAL